MNQSIILAAKGKRTLYTDYLLLKTKDWFVFSFSLSCLSSFAIVSVHINNPFLLFPRHRRRLLLLLALLCICSRCVLNIAYLPRWINLNHTRTRTVFLSSSLCVYKDRVKCVYHSFIENKKQTEMDELFTN